MNTTINVRPQILPTYGENSCPRDAGETRMSSDLSSSLHLNLYLRIRPPGTLQRQITGNVADDCPWSSTTYTFALIGGD
jgi:hypothetical protein